jgi:CheY-like chemotaxis protein
MYSGIKRILCADDEPANLKLLEALLVPRGYEVVKAWNGREALEKIGSQNIDLVLLDVMMPMMNGFEVCRTMKNDERYRNIPVVMITALTSKKDRIRGIEAGAEDFISKPFDQAEVVARVKMLLNIKELNDRLNSAYSNINNLISFGERIVKFFDPISFDFMTNIDNIVGQLIRKDPASRDKPRFAVVGLSGGGEGSWQWHKYEFSPSGLTRTALHHDVRCSVEMSEKGESSTIVCKVSDGIHSSPSLSLSLPALSTWL